MNFRIIPALLVFCGTAALAWFTGGFFNSTDVCTTCGASRDVRTVMWIPIAEVRETPLSLYLKSIRPVSPHSHDWLLVGGHGGPIRCALGGGGNIAQATRSHEIVKALKTIRKHRGDAEADQWIARTFDRKTTSGARMALYILGENSGDFDSDYAIAEEEFKDSQRSHSP